MKQYELPLSYVSIPHIKMARCPKNFGKCSLVNDVAHCLYLKAWHVCEKFAVGRLGVMNPHLFWLAQVWCCVLTGKRACGRVAISLLKKNIYKEQKTYFYPRCRNVAYACYISYRSRYCATGRPCHHMRASRYKTKALRHSSTEGVFTFTKHGLRYVYSDFSYILCLTIIFL